MFCALLYNKKVKTQKTIQQNVSMWVCVSVTEKENEECSDVAVCARERNTNRTEMDDVKHGKWVKQSYKGECKIKGNKRETES